MYDKIKEEYEKITNEEVSDIINELKKDDYTAMARLLGCTPSDALDYRVKHSIKNLMRQKLVKLVLDYIHPGCSSFYYITLSSLLFFEYIYKDDFDISRRHDDEYLKTFRKHDALCKIIEFYDKYLPYSETVRKFILESHRRTNR